MSPLSEWFGVSGGAFSSRTDLQAAGRTCYPQLIRRSIGFVFHSGSRSELKFRANLPVLCGSGKQCRSRCCRNRVTALLEVTLLLNRERDYSGRQLAFRAKLDLAYPRRIQRPRSSVWNQTGACRLAGTLVYADSAATGRCLGNSNRPCADAQPIRWLSCC